MTKIYTRTGDDGTTGLIGGARVPKSDPAIECYGTVDEANAAIGLAAVVAAPEVSAWLRQVQGELFAVGARLASPAGDASRTAGSLPPVDAQWVARLESQIDSLETTLPPLRNFILPGGTELAARLHVARTVCRRAERLIVALSTTRTLEPTLLTYINRLSDWLFVLARHANHRAGHPDVPWVSR